ncbi:hypothetical protein [Mycolicibacterium fortuitum]|uniref:hypothetical protein n=1 Tax=Mycolicibacterium fortuitum TaxID=1766 RepID=UPI001F2DC10F
MYQLQRLPGADTNDTFLYDDSFLHSNVSPPDAARSRGRDRVDAWCGDRPGRLAGLLKPALEIVWVDDARRMNKFLTAEVPDNQVVAAAHRAYAGQPPGIATWSGYKSSARLDIAFVTELVPGALTDVRPPGRHRFGAGSYAAPSSQAC